MEYVSASLLPEIRAARDSLERQLEADRVTTARLLAEGWVALARGWRLLADPVFRQAFAAWPSLPPQRASRPEPAASRTPRAAWAEWSPSTGGPEGDLGAP
jgi:hypothetical protein